MIIIILFLTFIYVSIHLQAQKVEDATPFHIPLKIWTATGAFPDGLYVICLETDKKILTKQIIIER